MKRLGRLLVCAALVLALGLCGPLALAGGDSEAELRSMLSAACGANIVEFYYGDYDGDGSHEAFAFVGQGEENSYQGGVWFVSASGAQQLQSNMAYVYFQLRGAAPTQLFLAEEGYGGSWSQSHMWLVSNGQPVATEFDPNEGENNAEFYEYPDAFDAMDDGTGHTWKRYYFYMENGVKREYGGIYISLDELCEFEGAREMIEERQANGCVVSGILYRANGVINVNFDQGMDNLNLSLRYDDRKVTYWEEDLGVYLPASDPSIATYPIEFRHPQGTPATQQPQVSPTLNPMPAADDAPRYTWDIDGDGAQETLTLRRAPGKGGSGFDTLEVILDVWGADGALRASGCVFNHYQLDASQASSGSIDLRLYALGNNLLYTEGASNFGDASSTAYRAVELTSGALVTQVTRLDPGYSDGYGLEDGLFGDAVFQTWDNAAGRGALIDPLEEAFSAYSLTFALAEDNRVRAQLGAQALICRINALELPESANQQPSTARASSSDGGATYSGGASSSGGGATYSGGASSSSGGGQSVSGSAHVTGDVNLRDAPNLRGTSLGVAYKGATLAYLGESSVDERGVTWYHVRYGNIVGWGSSKYVKLD